MNFTSCEINLLKKYKKTTTLVEVYYIELNNSLELFGTRIGHREIVIQL